MLDRQNRDGIQRMREVGTGRIALVRSGLPVAFCDRCLGVLLQLIDPGAEFLQSYMQAGFFEMLEGCIGGLDKILPCFFTLHILKNRFFQGGKNQPSVATNSILGAIDWTDF